MMKNKLFTSKLRSGLYILCIIGLLEFVGSKALSDYYMDEWSKLTQNALMYSLEKDDILFTAIHRELSAFVVNNDDMGALSHSYEGDPLDYGEASKRALLIVGIQKYLNNLCDIYGQDYYFWAYDQNTDSYIDYGVNDYNIRQNFRNKIAGKIASGRQQVSKYGRWFIQDRCIMTVLRQGNIYAGALISIDDYLESVAQKEITEHYKVYLADDTGMVAGGKEYDQGRYSDGGQYEPMKHYKSQREFHLFPENGAFSLIFQLDNSIIETTFVLEMLIISLALLYLLAVIIASFYIKRRVVKPLVEFYKKIENYSETTRFQDSANIIELNKTGEVLNHLSDQVRELKIEVYEKELMRQKIELDFSSLQIRPHFFINCLNVIYSMAQIDQMSAIQELCCEVSEYMRYLFKDSTESILLGEELDLVEHYLEVIKKIYGQKFDYMIDMDEALESQKIPPLIIQTFVENSIKYAGTAFGECILIEVKGRLLENETMLELTVQDSGKGFPQDVLEQLRQGKLERGSAGHHIGILNIIQRLSLIYGQKQKIILENNDIGAYVSVIFPAAAPDIKDCR